MRLSWNCLNELVQLDTMKPTEVANKLTIAGFETEIILYDNNTHDIIFDIDITSNRQDIKSIIDIALEISCITKQQLKIDLNITQNHHKHNINIKTITKPHILNDFDEFNYCIIHNTCLRYYSSTITKYLTNYELETNGTILDLINFMSIKWGQTIHVYQIEHNDHYKAHDFNFYINKNKHNQTIIYLNNQALKKITINNLDKNKNSNSNIVMITYIDTHLSNNNRSNQDTLLNPNWVIHAYKEIFDLLNSNKSSTNYLTIYMKNYLIKRYKSIICHANKINNILGPINHNKYKTFLKNSDIIEILLSLNFSVNYHNDIITIHIPNERTKDIVEEIDIIEEIGRIYGFKSFIDTLPKFHHINQSNKTITIKQKIRKTLRSTGLHEVINYSLHNPTIQPNNISIINPLTKEHISLRTNLINTLIETIRYNTNQSNHTFEIFEIGKVFYNNYYNNEHLHIGCILGNPQFNKSLWNNKTNQLSWFQAKGHLEELFEKINAKVQWTKYSISNKFTKHLNNYLDTSKTIYLNYQNQTIGIFSQINNKTKITTGLKHNLYIFEIDLNCLIESTYNQQHLKYIYKPYSQYPKIIRDTSITINQKICLQYFIKIVQMIKKENNNFIESINIVDEFHESNNTKNINLRITYRSLNQTLTNKEIKILDNIFKKNISLALQGKQSKT